MSRSLTALRYELKTNGQVRIPIIGPDNVLRTISFPGALALIGVGIWWNAPFNWGVLLLIITLFVSAFLILIWEIRDWRRQLIVSTNDLRQGRGQPIQWSEIEKVGVPAARSILSIQLTVDGFLRHFGEHNPSPEERAFLNNADDRVVTWSLSQSISDPELRFLREQTGR